MSDLVFDVALGPTARLLGVTYLHDINLDQDGQNIQLVPGGRVQVRDEGGVTHGGVVVAVDETQLGRTARLSGRRDRPQPVTAPLLPVG